jgi:hypothetical protein
VQIWQKQEVERFLFLFYFGSRVPMPGIVVVADTDATTNGVSSIPAR